MARALTSFAFMRFALTSLAVIRFAVMRLVVMRFVVIRLAETILSLATGLPAGEEFVLVNFGAGLLLIRDFFAIAMTDSLGL
ncbi:MAG TPA: hypothetical protein VE195_08870, partial [Acidobacteriaceae bacterium]|nr:hypothetical protein [Acidobacteriaceae bacterium]